MFPIQGTKASVVVHERLGGMLYNSNRAGQSGSSNVTSSHQISDYRRPKSTWTRLHWNPFGGSSSVVQRPPAQKVVVHERLGGMLCITRIDRVKVVVVMSLVFHQISDYRRPKSTWTRLQRNPFGDPHQ